MSCRSGGCLTHRERCDRADDSTNNALLVWLNWTLRRSRSLDHNPLGCSLRWNDQIANHGGGSQDWQRTLGNVVLPIRQLLNMNPRIIRGIRQRRSR